MLLRGKVPKYDWSRFYVLGSGCSHKASFSLFKQILNSTNIHDLYVLYTVCRDLHAYVKDYLIYMTFSWKYELEADMIEYMGGRHGNGTWIEVVKKWTSGQTQVHADSEMFILRYGTYSSSEWYINKNLYKSSWTWGTLPVSRQGAVTALTWRSSHVTRVGLVGNAWTILGFYRWQ